MQAKKIMIVEDDEFLVQMYATKLELLEYNVVTAGDGKQALKLVKKDKPDLILLDLNLPVMDGFQVLGELKKDPETKNIPVLVLTNYGQKEHVDRCLSLGAADYLIKAHFVPSEVVDKIKTLIFDSIKSISPVRNIISVLFWTSFSSLISKESFPSFLIISLVKLISILSTKFRLSFISSMCLLHSFRERRYVYFFSGSKVVCN